jgi:hypothetical protein
MTDRELLEAAAKAAGIVCAWDYYAGSSEGGGLVTDTGYLWDALTDDGDALRLAVKLMLDVNTGTCCSAASWAVNGSHLGNCVDEPHDGNPDAATRRAIVRAAAAIGAAQQKPTP